VTLVPVECQPALVHLVDASTPCRPWSNRAGAQTGTGPVPGLVQATLERWRRRSGGRGYRRSRWAGSAAASVQ
jgi:hypothetical protein